MIAKLVKSSPTTIYKKLRDPVFQVRVARTGHELLLKQKAILRKPLPKGISTLIRLCECGDPEIELKAASKIADVALATADAERLAKRVVDLSEQVYDQERMKSINFDLLPDELLIEMNRCLQLKGQNGNGVHSPTAQHDDGQPLVPGKPVVASEAEWAEVDSRLDGEPEG